MKQTRSWLKPLKAAAKMKWPQTLLWFILPVGLLILLIKSAAGASITTVQNNTIFFVPVHPLTIRVDEEGDGHYGAERDDHIHEGVDLECYEGQNVYAPISGEIRNLNVYADSTFWKGIEITGTNGYRIKIFYMLCDFVSGDFVSGGQVIGTAQKISDRYSSAMQDHIHVEVYYNDIIQDPTGYFFAYA